MARCNSCGLMASVEPDVNDVSASMDSPDGYFVSLDMVLNSACCGDEMATATVEETFDCDLKHTKPEGAADDWECEGEFTADASADPDEWSTPDVSRKTGKTLKSVTRYFGANVTVDVECSTCGAKESYEHQLGEESGNFEYNW